MFETRISKSWGVGENILARYFLESLTEDIDGGLLLFLARDKQTGRRLWLKVSDMSDSANAALAAEASVWEGVSHPHLLSPCQQEVESSQNFIAYPWKGEVPFQDADKAAMSPSDLVRVCSGFLASVVYLQSLEQPVAHNQIGLASLCLETAQHWPVLTGFQLAIAGASNKALKADRQACFDSIAEICFGTGMTGSISDLLDPPAKAWVKAGPEAAESLFEEMDREFIRRVTADL